MRVNCQFPDDCGAGARGRCRKCHHLVNPAEAAKHAERMKRLHADPEFIAARKARWAARHGLPYTLKDDVAAIRAKGFSTKQAVAMVKRDHSARALNPHSATHVDRVQP